MQVYSDIIILVLGGISSSRFLSLTHIGYSPARINDTYDLRLVLNRVISDVLLVRPVREYVILRHLRCVHLADVLGVVISLLDHALLRELLLLCLVLLLPALLDEVLIELRLVILDPLG